VIEFLQTAGVWIRGFVQHDYSVNPEDVEWHIGGFDEPGENYTERIPITLPQRIRRKLIPSGKFLNNMLEQG